MKRPNLTALLFIAAVLLLQVIVALTIGVFMRRDAFTEGASLFSDPTLAPAIVAAGGLCLVVAYRGIDFSAAGVIALSSVVCCLLMARTGTFTIGVLGGAATAAGAGLVSGLVVHSLRMPPYIATLATWGVMSHAALLLTDGAPMPIPDKVWIPAFESLTYPGLIMLAFLLLLPVILYMVAIWFMGPGPSSGMGVVTSYLLCALSAGLAGILLLSLKGQTTYSLGSGMQWKSIAAVVLGGAFLFRGSTAPLLGLLTTTLAVMTMSLWAGVADALGLDRTHVVGFRYLPPILCGLVYALAAKVLFAPPEPRKDNR